MTPAMRERNPDWVKLTAGSASVVALLGTLGFQILNPREQLAEYAARQTQVTQRIETQLAEQSRRIDSLAVVIDRVNALVQVKCIETNNRLIRQMLECRP